MKIVIVMQTNDFIKRKTKIIVLCVECTIHDADSTENS